MSSSIRSGILTLLHTACGAGILAMPYAFKPYGLIPGVAMIVFCGLCSMAGLLLQSKVTKYVPERNASFFALTQVTNPKLSVIFDFAIAIKCFGVGVSYMIVVGDVMPQILSTFTDHSILVNRNFNITVVMLCIVSPLCFIKNLNSLRYASMLAISSVIYLCILVLIHFVMPSDDVTKLKGEVSWFFPHESNSSRLSTLPIFIFAYTCHHNMFSVINEQYNTSFKSIKYIAMLSMLLACCLYVVIGGTGYLTFGDEITGNIITLYPQSIATTIGRIAIVFLVTLAFPLQCHPARASISHIIHYFKAEEVKSALNTLERTTLMDNEVSPSPQSLLEMEIPTEEIIEEEYPGQQQHFKLVPLTPNMFIIITSGILIAAYLLAISIQSLAHVLAIVGATGSTSIAFILPGVFGFQLIGSEYESLTSMPPRTRLLKGLAILLTLWGLFVMVTSLFAALFLGASH